MSISWGGSVRRPLRPGRTAGRPMPPRPARSGLKALAKELKVPVVVLAQLNRGPETRAGKEAGIPRMSDLRESGSIEQDADMIGLLYRSDYYAEDEDQRQQLAGQANLHLAKNRNGPTGDIPLRFEAELMRFSTREPEKK